MWREGGRVQGLPFSLSHSLCVRASGTRVHAWQWWLLNKFVRKICIPKHLLAPKTDAVKSPCKLSVSLFLSATNPIKLREHESTVCVLPYWLV